MRDTMSGAFGRRRADRLVFQHLLVRAGKRVNVKSAGAIADFTLKRRGVSAADGEDYENNKSEPMFNGRVFNERAFEDQVLGERASHGNSLRDCKSPG